MRWVERNPPPRLAQCHPGPAAPASPGIRGTGKSQPALLGVWEFSWAFWWLGLSAFATKGLGSIPGEGAKVLILCPLLRHVLHHMLSVSC